METRSLCLRQNIEEGGIINACGRGTMSTITSLYFFLSLSVALSLCQTHGRQQLLATHDGRVLNLAQLDGYVHPNGLQEGLCLHYMGHRIDCVLLMKTGGGGGEGEESFRVIPLVVKQKQKK